MTSVLEMPGGQVTKAYSLAAECCFVMRTAENFTKVCCWHAVTSSSHYFACTLTRMMALFVFSLHPSTGLY